MWSETQSPQELLIPELFVIPTTWTFEATPSPPTQAPVAKFLIWDIIQVINLTGHSSKNKTILDNFCPV